MNTLASVAMKMSMDAQELSARLDLLVSGRREIRGNDGAVLGSTKVRVDMTKERQKILELCDALVMQANTLKGIVTK